MKAAEEAVFFMSGYSATQESPQWLSIEIAPLKEAFPTLHSNFSEEPVSPRNANGVGKQGKLVGRAGFEPATNWLKANCSTI